MRKYKFGYEYIIMNLRLITVMILNSYVTA